jgi:hypothetical protein
MTPAVAIDARVVALAGALCQKLLAATGRAFPVPRET